MRAGMIWTPLYGDCADDPKFRLVARRSGQPLSIVFACWAQMLCPSRWAAPGILKPDADELIAVALDLDPDCVAAIAAAMQGLVLDGEVLSGWEKRRLHRPPAADASIPAVKPAALRQRRKRERDRTSPAALEPQLDLVPPGRDSVTPVTPKRDSSVIQGVTFHARVTPSVTPFAAPEQSVAPDVTPAAPESESEEEREEGFVRSARALAEGEGGAGRRLVDVPLVDAVAVEFGLWWARIENPVGHDEAMRAYRAARAEGASAAEIAQGWARYAATKPPDRLWMNPANWLAKRRWTDQPPADGAAPLHPIAGGNHGPRSSFAGAAARRGFCRDPDIARERRQAGWAAAVAERMAAGGTAVGAG